MILGFPPPPVQTLPEWLEIATRELTDASKERIGLEIEAHYAEAVEAHLENGSSESEAQKAALAELGNAHVAGKRFRKQYLTQEDIDRLKKWNYGVRSIWYPLGSYFLFWLFTTDLLPFRHHWLESNRPVPPLFASAFLVWVALPTACFVVARYARVRPSGPVLFMLIMLSGLAFCAFIFACCAIQPVFPIGSIIVNGFMGGFFWPIMNRQLYIFLHVRVKLSKESEKNLGQAS